MPRTGLATLIHMSYEGATIKSLGLLRAPGLFVCLLRQASSPRRQIKNPAQCAGFFYRAQDWIRTSTPFPALPPQGSASTNFATWAGLPTGGRGCKFKRFLHSRQSENGFLSPTQKKPTAAPHHGTAPRSVWPVKGPVPTPFFWY